MRICIVGASGYIGSKIASYLKKKNQLIVVTRKKNIKDIIYDEHFKKFKKVMKQSGTVEACNRCDWLQLNEKQF